MFYCFHKLSSNSRLFLYNCDTKATSTDTTYRSEQNNYHLKPLVQGLLPLISSHCHWLAPSSTTMNTHLQVACWEIQAAIHCYPNFFLFVLGTYGSHSIPWKKIMWFLPPYFRFFNKINIMAIISNFPLWTWVPHFWQKLKFHHSGDLT